jgi:SAM-dependent methyltransferase
VTSLVGRFHARAVFGRRVQVLAAHIASLVPRNARVVDVGCGDGSIAARVLQLRPDIEIVGIDVLVRPRTHIPVVRTEGDVIPYEDAAFDTVLLVDMLHHTLDPTRVLKEAARVSPGTVVVKDHLADGVLARPTLRLMDWVGNAHLGIEMPYEYWTEARWRQAFADAGLVPDVWRTALNLYPPPASWVFDRRLHMLCRASVGSASLPETIPSTEA